MLIGLDREYLSAYCAKLLSTKVDGAFDAGKRNDIAKKLVNRIICCDHHYRANMAIFSD